MRCKPEVGSRISLGNNAHTPTHDAGNVSHVNVLGSAVNSGP